MSGPMIPGPKTGNPSEPGLYACKTIVDWKFLRWDGKVWWFDILSAHWVPGALYWFGPLQELDPATLRDGPPDTKMYDL